jgi:hypothetical protein
MIRQPLNPPQRSNAQPGPESSAVPPGKRGAPIGRSCSGASHGRFVWFGYSYRGAAGSHGKRERSRRARGDEQAVAAQRSRKRSIALGEFKIQSPRRLLPVLGERFVRYWLGVVCELRQMDHIAIGAPKYGTAIDVAGARGHVAVRRIVDVSTCGTGFLRPRPMRHSGSGPPGNTSWLHATRKASYQVCVKLTISSSTLRPPIVTPE